MRDLVGLGIAVARRPALDDVGDVDLLARQADGLDDLASAAGRPGRRTARPARPRRRPGASPTNIRRACGLPTPNTTWRAAERVQLAARAVADVRRAAPPAPRPAPASRRPRPVRRHRRRRRVGDGLGRPARRGAAAGASRRSTRVAPRGVAAHAVHAEVAQVVEMRGAGRRGRHRRRRRRAARRRAGARARSRMRRGDVRLGLQRQRLAPVVADEGHRVGVDVEAGAGLRARRWRR